MSEETPLDRFKRALTGGARAIAREPEVEVAWSADRPGAAGKNFRVPLPGRQLPAEQAAEPAIDIAPKVVEIRRALFRAVPILVIPLVAPSRIVKRHESFRQEWSGS